MADILHEVTIAVLPEKVYRALTEEQGLSAWWTDHIEAKATVGSTLKASFMVDRHPLVHQMEVLTLEPGSKVEWAIRHGGYPDWNGTRITWDLSPEEKGTKVLFGHRGWNSTDGTFALVKNGWAVYLASLKEYFELGKGHPHSFQRSAKRR